MEQLEAFIAIHKEGTRAFNEGDLERALGGLPADVEWHAVSEDPDAAVLRGPEQVKAFLEKYRDVFEHWHSEPLGYEELGENTVLVHHLLSGTSRGAGVPVEVDTFELWELEGFEPRRIRQFLSRDQALAALSED